MSPLRRFIVVFLLVTCAGAHAAVPAPSQEETTRLLRQRAYSELDRRFGAVQAAYAAKQIGDEQLRAAFRVFYPTDPALAPVYDEWVKQSPRSYVAHLARGIYYKVVGGEQRGTAYIRDTSSARIQGMKAAHAIAAEELEASRRLDRRPLLSIAHQMDIELHAGAHVALRKLLDAAIIIDPATLMAREKYMASLRSQWGGSTERMRQFYAECKASGVLNVRQLGVLESQVYENEARLLWRAGDKDGAARVYDRAAELDPESGCVACGTKYLAAQRLNSAGKFAEAIQITSELLEKHPNNVKTLAMRGVSYLGIGKGAEGQADLLRAATLGHACSQTELARLLLKGELVPRDPRAAAGWLEKAAAQDYEPARKLLPQARSVAASVP